VTRPKDLKRAIKRPHHCTPTLDDVLPKLNRAKYFSIVNSRSGYWNIKLDHASSLYTTFNSPHGRYRFLRLPFGLICAEDIFQKKVNETFSDLPGVTGIADDIVIYGSDLADHNANLKAVMERACETSLRFNIHKCKIRCTEIQFFGHIVSTSGLRPDPQKVEAIRSIDPLAIRPYISKCKKSKILKLWHVNLHFVLDRRSFRNVEYNLKVFEL